MADNQVLIVTGMHRSGTSWVAGALHASGVVMGEQLLGAARGNPHGHFEDREFLQLQMDLLTRAKLEGLHHYRNVEIPPAKIQVDEASVDRARQLIENRRQYPRWGFKDPRAVYFLDLWISLLPGVKFVCLYRDPLDTCMSLFNRGNGFVDLGGAFLGFQDVIRRALAFKEAHADQMLLCNINRVISDPLLFERTLQESAGIRVEGLAENLQRTFVAQSFSHVRASADTCAQFARVFPQAARMYVRAEQMAELPSASDLTSRAAALTERTTVGGVNKEPGEAFFISLIRDSLNTEEIRDKVILGLLENIKLIGELYAAKEWLEEQRQNWMRTAEERERIIRLQERRLRQVDEYLVKFKLKPFLRLGRRLGLLAKLS